MTDPITAERGESIPYDLFQHRHNFAAWAAARAAQRGFTTIKRLCDALDASGVVSYVRENVYAGLDDTSFDQLHRLWCDNIVAHLQNAGIPNTTFGRAAKLVAVYLKAMVIVGPASDSPLAKMAHPPIDRLLLRRLARLPGIPASARQTFLSTNWTDIDADEYYQLVRTIRKEVPGLDPFWRLERYWRGTQEGE